MSNNKKVLNEWRQAIHGMDLDKPKVCPYCQGQVVDSKRYVATVNFTNKSTFDRKVTMKVAPEAKFLEVYLANKPLQIPINNCPFCGRSL